MNFVTIGLLTLLGLLLIVIVATYNRLVVTRMRIKESWSNVDTELKRRHDLIPNLVEVVKGYAQHERGLFDEVARTRAHVAAQREPTPDREADERALAGGLARLIAVAESYPELKASAQFLHLQRQLVDTEDRIQAARRFFNSNVRDHNNLVEQFPSRILARMFGFGTQRLFELASAAPSLPPRAG